MVQTEFLLKAVARLLIKAYLPLCIASVSVEHRPDWKYKAACLNASEPASSPSLPMLADEVSLLSCL